MLQLDGTAPDGSRTAFLVMETADGGVSVECEAEVAGDVLLLVDDDGTSYRFEWDGGLGEAALPTMRLFKVELALP